ncbi:hypothetical protein ACHAXT_010189 [Thalassiosira profunda]
MARRACLALLGLSCLLPSSLGFAAWLKCNRLLEEDEIIMNNKVRKAPAEGPAVKLAVYDEAGTRVDVSSDGNGDATVWVDEQSSPLPLSFTIKMDHESIEGLSDIQFLVETEPFDWPYDIPPESFEVVNKWGRDSFASASNGGGILCGGARGHARGKNGSVTYELVPKDGGNDLLLSKIVAGYAEYHGPVALTPRVLFKRKGGNPEIKYHNARGEL